MTYSEAIFAELGFQAWKSGGHIVNSYMTVCRKQIRQLCYPYMTSSFYVTISQ